jgi:hypothetical protein
MFVLPLVEDIPALSGRRERAFIRRERWLMDANRCGVVGALDSKGCKSSKKGGTWSFQDWRGVDFVHFLSTISW